MNKASYITPVEPLKKLSDKLKIDLKVKRDDLYPFTGGGNKARKIRYLLKDAEKKGANAFVTTGASNSNHARVVAIQAAQKSWPVKIVVEGDENYKNANLQLMELVGADLIFVHKSEIKEAMDRAMELLQAEGYNPYYIWGGGHMVQGIQAYYDAVIEFLDQSQGWVPDYVIHASGTGGTQTGLHIGFSVNRTSTKVIGISVSRNEKTGKKSLKESVINFCDFFQISVPKNEIIFLDNWVGAGYREVCPELFDIIRTVASKEGLITDPTYTGKAMKGLFDLCETSWIEENSKVLFWHTGGLLNLIQDSNY